MHNVALWPRGLHTVRSTVLPVGYVGPLLLIHGLDCCEEGRAGSLQWSRSEVAVKARREDADLRRRQEDTAEDVCNLFLSSSTVRCALSSSRRHSCAKACIRADPSAA